MAIPFNKGVVLGHYTSGHNRLLGTAHDVYVHESGLMRFWGYDPTVWNVGGRTIVTTTNMFMCDGVIHDGMSQLMQQSNPEKIMVHVVENLDNESKPVIIFMTNDYTGDTPAYIYDIDGQALNKTCIRFGESTCHRVECIVMKMRKKVVGPYDRIRWKESEDRDMRVSMKHTSMRYSEGKLHVDAILTLSIKSKSFTPRYIGPFKCKIKYIMSIVNESIEIIDGMKEDENGKYLEWVFNDICKKAN